MNLLSAYGNMICDGAWISELLLLSLTWAIFCIRKPNALRICLYTAGLAAVLFVGNMGLFLLSGKLRSLFPLLWSCGHGVISLCFLWIFAPYHPKNKALLWMVLYNVVISASMLGGKCSFIASTMTDNSLIIGSVRASFYLLMPLSALFMRRRNLDAFIQAPNNCLLLAGLLLISELAFSAAEAMVSSPFSTINIIFVMAFVCMLSTNLATFQALHTICLEQQRSFSLSAENQRYQAEREVARMAETSLEDLRCIRHDLKNQYGYLQILVQEKRYEELEQYLQSLQSNLPLQLNFTDCGNQVVNTALNMEIAKFRSMGITLSHRLVVPPVLPFGSDDVCSMLFNLLDNAREECSRLMEKGVQDVRARLEIHPHQSYLLIRCLNSTDRTSLPRKGGGLLSTKSKAEYHGYGTRIITRLAEKYNGCADFKLENGMFLAQVMLDMTEGSHT
nr:GHKL domain-containing protein [Clostridia bacterium]